MTNTVAPGLPGADISDEQYREYDFAVDDGYRYNYRIDDPSRLFTRTGGTTHRVLDSTGIVHCVPAPGQKGCVLRWKPRDPSNPVAF